MEKRCMSGPVKIMIKKYVAFSFLLSTTSLHPLFAQFSLNAYLGDARNDIRLFDYYQRSEFLQRNPYRSPLIHRFEFRTRSNDFNLSQDDFRLRINPTNPFEIRANKDYYDLETDALVLEYQYALNRSIHRRYHQIIACYQLQDEIILMEREITLQKDQLKILEANLNNSGFEISEYIDQKENLIDMVLEMNELRHDHEKIIHEIRSEYSFSGNIRPNEISLISNYQIKNIIELKSEIADTSNNIHIENLNYQAMLDEQRIRVEQAEGKRNIGYLQAEYDRFRGDDFNKHLGYQIGIRIPVTNPDRPDLNRRKLELVDDKADILREKTALEVQCELLKMDLSYLFSQDELIGEAISNDTLLKLLQQDANIGPQDLIEAQKSILKMKRYDQLIQWEIYKSFIDYLYYSGKLIDVPLRNYLSENLDAI